VIILTGLSERNSEKLLHEGAISYVEKSDKLLEKDGAVLIQAVARVLGKAAAPGRKLAMPCDYVIDKERRLVLSSAWQKDCPVRVFGRIHTGFTLRSPHRNAAQTTLPHRVAQGLPAALVSVARGQSDEATHFCDGRRN
jgi:hypothetical protein